MRWEGVPGQAERADPELAANVNLAVWIEDGSAWRLAGDWLVEDGRQVLAGLQRRVERCNGHDYPRCFDARRWPATSRCEGQQRQREWT